MKKVVFVCSSGGHLTELLCLKSLFKEYSYLLVTEKTRSTEYLKEKYENVEYVKYGSRQYLFSYFFICLYNIANMLRIIVQFNPEIVVTTGAHTGGMFCFLSKILGKKIIYIETLAKVTSLSGTGKVMYYIADKFFVQWEDLTDIYPKAEYIGRLR